MQIQILAIGQKMPKWCQMACEEYLSRLKFPMKCALIELPLAKRTKTGGVSNYKNEEAHRLLSKISPHSHVVALDVKGTPWSTPQLSSLLGFWQQQAKDLVFMIGGPEGLSEKCLARANQCWSLSALTFPHTLARVVVLEQLYRAWTILNNHPYHKD